MLKLIENKPAEPDGPRSQTSAAYARLKGDLLAGRVPPGEKLKINELADQLGVSPGAIREALSRLVPEGFVLSRDQKGFVVAPLSIDDLQDLTALRCEIEEICLRRALSTIDAEWEAMVLSTAHRLRRTPRLVDGDMPNPEWGSRHDAFHRALVSGCGSPRLVALHHQLYQQSERYRIFSWNVDRSRDVDTEHQALVDAALDRDVEELVRLARAHFQRTTDLIVSASESALDSSAG